MDNRKRKNCDNGKNSGGRPKKLKRSNSTRGGRKQVVSENMSRSTKHRRVVEVLDFVRNDVSVLKSAIKEDQRLNACSDVKEHDMGQNKSERSISRPTNESAFTFYLENDLTKKNTKHK